jgi:hypothetical protein
MLSQCLQHRAAIVLSLRPSRFRFQGLLISGQGFFQAVEHLQNIGQVEPRLGIVRLDLQRQGDVGQRFVDAPGLRPRHAQKMTGGEIAWLIRQHLEIQALGLRQPSAALQRNGLVIQGFSIHVSRIRSTWYPFANHEKQWGWTCSIAAISWP